MPLPLRDLTPPPPAPASPPDRPSASRSRRPQGLLLLGPGRRLAEAGTDKEKALLEELEGDDRGILNDTESLASFSILYMLLLLFGSLLLGYVLHKRKVKVMQEAGAALLVGVFAGLVVFLANGRSRDRADYIAFQKEFFFLFLLPPIIFEAGYGMQVRPFFRNFGAICMFAFVGTAVSTFLVGLLMYGLGQAGACHEMPLLENLLFGSLISATDPVTVLAIFTNLKVEVNMYSLVFGESVMNDAVAIVLYRALLTFKTVPVNGRGVGLAFASFFVIFLGSFLIGTGVAVASALIFKQGEFRKNSESTSDSILESVLVIMVPYMAYMLAEGLELSGIVAILFCGILMKHYTTRNLSEKAKETCHAFFQIAAKTAETFIFIYMGVEVFLADQSWQHLTYFLFALCAILLARVFNVFPGAYLVNLARRPEAKIPYTYQKMLWFSGLRGGIAFALALGTKEDLAKQDARVMLNATLLIVLVTVLGIGGFTTHALEFLGIQLGEKDEEAKGGRTRTPRGEGRGRPEFHRLSSSENGDTDEERGRGGAPEQRFERYMTRKMSVFVSSVAVGGFEYFDKRYLMPIFTNASGYDDQLTPGVELLDRAAQKSDAAEGAEGRGGSPANGREGPSGGGGGGGRAEGMEEVALEAAGDDDV